MPALSRMDFDDQLIDQLHRPESPPTPEETTNTTETPTRPVPAHPSGGRVGESYYIRPIPSGLRGSSLSDLMTLCHNHTLQHGFDVVKKAGVKPTTTKNGKKAIIPNASYYKWHITCVLAGKTKNTRHLTEEQRQREKSSLKQGCPSRVWAWAVDRNDPTGPWEIRWGDTDPALHNHPPVDVRTLPNHRRRAREKDGVAPAIRAIAEQGLGRKEGLERLKALFPDGLFSEKDMANEIQKWKGILKQEREERERENQQEQPLQQDQQQVPLQPQQIQALQGQVQQQQQQPQQIPSTQGFVATSVPAVPGFW